MEKILKWHAKSDSKSIGRDQDYYRFEKFAVTDPGRESCKRPDAENGDAYARVGFVGRK